MLLSEDDHEDVDDEDGDDIDKEKDKNKNIQGCGSKPFTPTDHQKKHPEVVVTVVVTPKRDQ